MKDRKQVIPILLAALVLVCSVAHGGVVVEYIGPGAATAISADGSVVVGNTQGDYEPYRWTSANGIELLGRASIPILGSSAGAPDVSDDGRFVSSTIIGADSTYITIGRWSEATGWEEGMPPPPPGGQMMSEAHGSAWGISDDGSTLVGLYWLGGGDLFGSANAVSWSRATGALGMGSTVGNSRANDANADGTILVGWDEAPFGTWQPTVWENGTITHLSEPDAFTAAEAITPDGNMIVGSSAPPGPDAVREAALWIRNGSQWDEHLLGNLPGTALPFGNVAARGISDDGSIIVGFNAWDPGWSTGFIWTLEDGMMDVVDYLADHDASLTNGLRPISLTDVSADGKHIAGIAQQTFPPYGLESFIIHIQNTTAVAETPGPFALGSNFPNPFNPQTTIPVTMSKSGHASLDIYDASGRLVRSLFSGILNEGPHQFIWNGQDSQGNMAASGVYFSRISNDSGQSLEQRMVLVK